MLMADDVETEDGVCAVCGGDGQIDPPDDGRNHNPIRCAACDGVGFTAIEPTAPAKAAPGSKLKVAYLVARYAAGVELWNEDDGPE